MSAEQRREQLLDVTKELVGERGFHAVTIDAVARRAGISRPIVYAHFEDLADLLESMLERESAGALAQLGAILPADDGGQDPREALLAAFRGYLETVRRDPITWSMVLMPPEGAPQLLRDQIRSGREAVLDVLARFIEPGLPPGRVSPDPELTARLLSAIADEAARLLLTNRRRFPIDRLVDQARWLLESER